MILKKTLTIRNSQGLHARPASVFVQIANKYEADIAVHKNGESVNGKSIMGLLMLAAGPGSTIELEISGADAEEAMKELEQFLIGDEEPAGPAPA